MHNRKIKEFEEKVLRISRVSKKTKGGNSIGFSALVVVGDRKGRVGLAVGKAKDVLSAIKKAVKKAKKKVINVPIDGTTTPFDLTVKYKAAKVMIKPAAKGSGIIAGSAVRTVLELAGYRDISSKILGCNNQVTNAYAIFKTLQELDKIVQIRGIKLKSLAEAEEIEKQKMDEKQAKAQDQSKKRKVVKKKSSAKSLDKTKKRTKKTASVKTKKAVKKVGKVKKTTQVKKSSTNSKK